VVAAAAGRSRLAWPRARSRRGLRFLLAWFAAAFVALTAVKSKQIHYTTLLVPAVRAV